RLVERRLGADDSALDLGQQGARLGEFFLDLPSVAPVKRRLPGLAEDGHQRLLSSSRRASITAMAADRNRAAWSRSRASGTGHCPAGAEYARPALTTVACASCWADTLTRLTSNKRISVRRLAPPDPFSERMG